MAQSTRVAPRDTRPTAEGVRYEDDTYRWSLEQSALLKAGRFGEVDLAHIIDEIEDVGHAQYDKAVSALRILLLHMLKWDFQPQRRSRSRAMSIRNARLMYERQMARNPSLRSRRSDMLAEAYADAIGEASSETDLPIETFPETCQWALGEILERPFAWPPAAEA